MAEKKNKRPSHTKLVVPGSGGGGKAAGQPRRFRAAGRLGRALGGPHAGPMAGRTPPQGGYGGPAGSTPPQGGYGGLAGGTPPQGGHSTPPTSENFHAQAPAPPQGALPRAVYDQDASPREGATAQHTQAQNAPAQKNTPPQTAPARALFGEQAQPAAQPAARTGGRAPTGGWAPTGPDAKAKARPARKKKPRRAKKLTPRKRRRRRRLLALAAVAAAVVLVWAVVASGLYTTAATLVSDAFEGLHIAARPGGGFPAEFAVIGFIKAEPMGTNGFVALGEKELSIVSQSGLELRRVQHNYLQPGVSAGNTRAVLYNRGGKEYTVEGRGKTLAHGATEMDIQFAELSPGGWLAVASSSRYRSELAVYGPAYAAADPVFVWRQADERPILAAFHADNRNLLLGCVSARGGALGSTLYVLRTDRDEPTAEIRSATAQLLSATYLDNHGILAVYDSFTALYNQRGEELARYEYGENRLLNADIWGGRVALLFGSTAQETLHTVLLSGGLDVLFDVRAVTGYSTLARVLADADGAFLLSGQQVTAYDDTGAVAATRTLERKPYTLTHGGGPLVLTSGQADSLDDMLRPGAGASGVSGEVGALAEPGASSPSGSENAGVVANVPSDESNPASGATDASNTSDASGSTDVLSGSTSDTLPGDSPTPPPGE